jgi:hypothetical protein
MTKTRNILESVFGDAHPRLRHGTTVQGLVEEILPFLVDILQPSLRPVRFNKAVFTFGITPFCFSDSYLPLFRE